MALPSQRKAKRLSRRDQPASLSSYLSAKYQSILATAPPSAKASSPVLSSDASEGSYSSDKFKS